MSETRPIGKVLALALMLLVGLAAGAQEAQGSRTATTQQEPTQEADPPVTGVVSGMSDAEEDALRLVEEILAEQQEILAGRNFVYRSEGRRDPFRNILLLRRREIEAPTERPPGLGGFLISEVAVSATARFQGRWHVLLTGLDQRTYTAGVGAELYDGRIVSISMNEVVFEQEVQDMLGARSTRQVVRKLNEDQD